MTQCKVSQWILLLLLSVHAAAAFGEQSLTKEQQLSKLKLRERILALEERRTSLQTHREELQTTRELFDGGFVALQKLKQTRNRFEQARLDYEWAEIALEEAKLELLRTATHIIISEARKYKTEEGKFMVDVVLENASDIRDALLVDAALTEEELRTLLKVEHIFASISYGPIVGEPYEIRIPSLEVGEQRKITYRLLRDEEAVYVNLKYLDIKDEKPVILKKGSQQDLPSINSAQFSQEGELNQTVRFGLTLQRLAEEERNFALAVIGLPPRIDYAFVNQGAKVNQIKFDETTSEVKLSLEMDIPEKLDRKLVEVTRTFFALVTNVSEYAKINDLRARYGEKEVQEEDVKLLKANYVRLELIPKGIGKLEVLISNRYLETEVGEELQFRVEFLNRGTVAVQNIRAELDLPYEWESSVEPKLLKLLEPGESGPISIWSRPPENIAVGDYEVGVEAQGQVGTENIESLEKNITVRIGARSNITGNAILIGVLVLMVVGIGVASVKISRK